MVDVKPDALFSEHLKLIYPSATYVPLVLPTHSVDEAKRVGLEGLCEFFELNSLPEGTLRRHIADLARSHFGKLEFSRIEDVPPEIMTVWRGDKYLNITITMYPDSVRGDTTNQAKNLKVTVSV